MSIRLSGREKHGRRGFSIVEVVVSMALLMAALMTLAFVYPRGKTMTDSNKLSMQATEIARSIIEEIRMRPVNSKLVQTDISTYGLLNNNGDIGSPGDDTAIANLSSNKMGSLQWPFHHFADSSNVDKWKQNCPVYCWGATDISGSIASIDEFRKTNLSVLDNTKTFFLPSTDLGLGKYGGIIPKGIIVSSVPANPAPAANIAPALIGIAVTVAWIESKGVGQDSILYVNHVTLNSYITENRYAY